MNCWKSLAISSSPVGRLLMFRPCSADSDSFFKFAIRQDYISKIFESSRDRFIFETLPQQHPGLSLLKKQIGTLLAFLTLQINKKKMALSVAN